MIGIYSIMHRKSGKRYVGKSIDVNRRLVQHKHESTKESGSDKRCSPKLRNAVQKYGWDAFDIEILEVFDHVEADKIASRELYWMDHFDTCSRSNGYNLRRDSSGGMIPHIDTRVKITKTITKQWANGERDEHSDKLKAAWEKHPTWRKSQSKVMSKNLTKWEYVVTHPNGDVKVVLYPELAEIGIAAAALCAFHGHKRDWHVTKSGYRIERRAVK